MAVHLSWGVRTQADEQRVYRSASVFDGASLPTALATISASATSYTDTTAAPETTYFYAVGQVKTGSPDAVALSEVLRITTASGGSDALLLESGDVLLMESGDQILLE